MNNVLPCWLFEEMKKTHFPYNVSEGARSIYAPAPIQEETDNIGSIHIKLPMKQKTKLDYQIDTKRLNYTWTLLIVLNKQWE